MNTAAAETTHETVSSNSHPRGLYALFFTEAWERFSYYGMRALLVPYMVQYHGQQPGQASSVYKWYTSLVYLTPLLGGFLADRYLGLRSSIIIGGILMAIGHFLMAFEPLSIFYIALAFLIAGNGFFKPNISTLVGKMYRKEDARRDRAFTIFYMGINIGAFVSSIACPWLRVTYGFHYGFGLAGVGMVIGLVIFLLTQRQVIADVEAAGNHLKSGKEKVIEEHTPEADESKPGAEGFAKIISKTFPALFALCAAALPAWYIWEFIKGQEKATNLIMPIAFGLVFAWMSWTLKTIRGASRDKSIVIFIFFIFSVLFWMAFEQAGNALNLWAEFHTDLHIGSFAYPAGWWQAVNALLIFLLAPAFSMVWAALSRRGIEPSTATKMFLAMVFIALSFVVMVFGAHAENKTISRQSLEEMPQGIDLKKVNAGRLVFDADKKELIVHGVLPRYVTNDLLDKLTPEIWKKEIESIEELTRKASEKAPIQKKFTYIPEGFVFPYDEKEAKGFGMSWDASSRTMTFTNYIEPPQRKTLSAAGSSPKFRDTLWELEKKSTLARVSGIWLFLSYLLATLGELCLSPVGLSMVTKLAPLRFASLFMGVWHLASSVAQYAGGSIGESWGHIVPTNYFMLFVWTSLIGAVLLFLLIRPLKRLMHEVT